MFGASLDSLNFHARRINSLIAKWGWILILGFAICYYGLYYRTGLNLGGEGGTNGVLTLRLMEGQRPIVDTFLGYNLMWFYPLAGLFYLTGPDYLAMKVFFFAICALTALLGFKVVWRCSQHGWLSLAVGIILVLIPGMIFRNYMGLIAIFSMYLFINGFVLEAGTRSKQLFWMAAAGAGLGFCYLIRIEPSMILTVIFLGLIVLYPFGNKRDFPLRTRQAILGATLGVTMLIVTHLPFVWHSQMNGFGEAFLNQYTSFFHLFRHELKSEVEKLKKSNFNKKTSDPESKKIAEAQTASNISAKEPTSVRNSEPGRESRRGRPDLNEIFGNGTSRVKAFAAIIYYPIALCALLIPAGATLLTFGILRGNLAAKKDGLLVLVPIGCSLSLFPQYFFFRPDAPHLSEFMVPFIAALAIASSALLRFTWYHGAWLPKMASISLAALATIAVPIYMKAIMPRESAGTIFKTSSLRDFQALNGVRVKLPLNEASSMEGLRDAILNNSTEEDFVICYPYSPTINFMTNRRSYEYNLYVDNATAGQKFDSSAIERLNKFQPAVVVIDNRAINGTDESRFKNWAKVFMNKLEEKYQLEGVYKIGSKENSVYLIKK